MADPAEKPEAPSPEPKASEPEKIEQPDALGLKDIKPEPEGGPEAKDEAKAEPAPEPVKYEDFKLPEGVTASEEQMAKFKEVAAEGGLSQEQAQRFIDLHAAEIRQAAEAPIKEWLAHQKKWAEEVQADKELGGDNLASTKVTIAKAIERFGGPDLAEALILTGAGNNPAIIRFVHRMAKELVERGPGPQGNPANEKTRDPAKIMYPNLP